MTGENIKGTCEKRETEEKEYDKRKTKFLFFFLWRKKFDTKQYKFWQVEFLIGKKSDKKQENLL